MPNFEKLRADQDKWEADADARAERVERRAQAASDLILGKRAVQQSHQAISPLISGRNNAAVSPLLNRRSSGDNYAQATNYGLDTLYRRTQETRGQAQADAVQQYMRRSQEVAQRNQPDWEPRAPYGEAPSRRYSHILSALEQMQADRSEGGIGQLDTDAFARLRQQGRYSGRVVDLTDYNSAIREMAMYPDQIQQEDVERMRAELQQYVTPELEGTQEYTAASQYLRMLDELVSGGALGYAAYTAQRLAQGSLGTINNFANGLEAPVMDFLSNGTYSDGYQKLENYFNGAYGTPINRAQMEASPSRDVLRTEVANQLGIDKRVVDAYLASTRNEMIDQVTEPFYTNVSQGYQNTVGNMAYMLGDQLTRMALGAAVPTGSSGSGGIIQEVMDGTSVRQSLSNALQNALSGNMTTYLSGASAALNTYAETARNNGYDPLNYVNALSQGAIEYFTEGLFGISDAQSVSALFNTARGSTGRTIASAIMNWLITGAEEGLEEVVNVPLSGIAESLTTDPDKPISGPGGIFDWDAMIENGVSGAIMGLLLGGVGGIAGTQQMLSESGDIRAAGERLNRINQNLPQAYRLSPMSVDSATMDSVNSYSAELLQAYNRLQADEIANQEGGSGFSIVLPRAGERLVLPTAADLERMEADLLQRRSPAIAQSGREAGATSRDIQTAQRLSDALGRDVRFYRGDRSENGYYAGNTIYINTQSANTVSQIIAHELTHSIEQAGNYGNLSRLVLSRIQQQGGNLEQLRQAKRELYARNGHPLQSDTEVDQEIIAQYVEQNLLTNEAEIQSLVQQNRSLGQRIHDWIDSILAKLGNSNAQERQFLTRARELYARALRQSNVPQQTARQSTQQTTQRAAQPAAQQTAHVQARPVYQNAATRPQNAPSAQNVESVTSSTANRQSASEGQQIPPELARAQRTITQRNQETARGLIQVGMGMHENSQARVLAEELQGKLDRGENITSRDLGALHRANMQAIQNGEQLEKNVGTESGQTSAYSIDPTFSQQIDDWDGDQRVTFHIGATSQPLQEIGVQSRDIILHSDKVKNILQKHKKDGMTKGVVKQVPNILENPIIILKSKTFDSRIVMFGEVYDTKGNPVTAILELQPTSRGGKLLDLNIVASIYGKDSNLPGFIESSPVLYLDRNKNRTNTWLQSVGLQLPSDTTMYGPVGSISYADDGVKIQGVPWLQIVGDSTGRQYSLREDRHQIASELRDILNRGGSAAELRQYVNGLDQGYADSYASTIDNYEDVDASQEIINEAHRQGLSVDEYLRQNWDIYEYDGTLNEDARRALDSERRYSVEDLGPDRSDEDFVRELAAVSEELLGGNRQESVPKLREDLDDYWTMISGFSDLEAPTDPDALVQANAQRDNRSAGERARDAWSYFRRKFVDSGEAVDRIGKRVEDKHLYPYYNMARASTNAATSMITDSATDIYGKRTGKGLNEIFQPIRKKGEAYYNDFQKYMFHRHNVDRMSRYDPFAIRAAQDAFEDYLANTPELSTYADYQIEQMAYDPTSLLNMEARDYVELRNAMRQTEGRQNKPVFGGDVSAEQSALEADRLISEYPEFAEYEEDVRAYINNLMQYRVDSGLVSAEDAEMLNAIYPHYVPTYRTYEKSGRGRRSNTVQVGQTIGRATGGGSRLMPLHQALAQQTLSVVREGSKNRFGLRLLQDVQDKRNVTDYVRNIQRYRGNTDSTSAFDADSFDSNEPRINSFIVRDGDRMWEMTVSPALFEAVEALSPSTQESNILFRAVRGGNNLFKALVTGYNPTFTVRNFIRDLQDAGLYSQNALKFAKNYPKAYAQMAKNGELWQQYKALGGLYSSVMDFRTGDVRQDNFIKRNTLGRIEALNQAIEQAPRFAEFMASLEGKEGTMEDLMDAMYNAADITTNFGRSGTWGKFLNATFVPFLNPGIQGFSKAVRTVTETRGFSNWARLIGKAALFGVAPTFLNALLYGDDDEWDDLKDRDKDVNYLFKIKDGLWLKIPKGRTLSVLGMAADRLVDLIKGEDVDWLGFITTAIDQSAPANPLTNNIASAIIQTDLFDPDSPGTTWYGGDIESQRLQGYAPGERYDEDTDKFSRWLGKTLGLSPKKINYLLEQYTGVIGDVLLPLMTPASERDMFSAAFTIDSVASNRLSEDFYDTLDELTYQRNSVNADGSDQVIYRYWNKQADTISDVNAKIREIEADENLSDAEKDDLIHAQYEIRNGLIRSALDNLDSYRETAVSNYLHAVGDDEDERIENAYMETNRDILGAAYALEAYNKNVYEAAQRLNQEGVSYDAFFDVYMDFKQANKLEGYAASNAKRQAIMDSGLDDEKKAALYRYAFGSFEDGKYVSSRDDDITALQNAGLDFNQFLQAQNEYSAINAEDIDASQKALEFSRWVNGQGYTANQADAVQEAFKYYNMNPANADQYEELLDSQIDEEKAYDLVNAFSELEPIGDAEQVSYLQKYRAIVDQPFSEWEQLTALGVVMPEETYEKVEIAHQYGGMSPRDYVAFQEILPQYDVINEDGSGEGSYGQDEVEAALNAMDISNESKAALWQIYRRTWKWYNNPYNTSVSREIYYALNPD